MLIADQNYYPVSFRSQKVINRDGNGYPTLTRFYKNNINSEIVFEWVQTWTSTGELDTWKIQNVTD